MMLSGLDDPRILVFFRARSVKGNTLNNDCTVTLTPTNSIIFDFVATDESREIQFMRSQDFPGTKSVITGVATKQGS